MQVLIPIGGCKIFIHLASASLSLNVPIFSSCSRPNEFFSNNWVYEGLTAYGANGKVEPALASSWTEAPLEGGGAEYVFTMREGVTFHDGAAWDCSVAKLNFDHVLAGGLRGGDWHGWYGLMDQIDTWECNEDGQLVVTTKDSYYPFLQELSFIRPLRMLSPQAFVGGAESDPYTANSCHAGWGTVTADGFDDVICAGTTAISGTGPFKFESRESLTLDDGETTVDTEVVFSSFADYWGGMPDIETLKVVRYESSEDVKEALLNGSLDLVWGSGVLSPDDLTAIEIEGGDLEVYQSDDIQNAILLVNSLKAPTNDINVRKAIAAALDRRKLIDDNLGGLYQPVENIFPRDSPFGDVDINPPYEYDLDLAKELAQCEEETADEPVDGTEDTIGEEESTGESDPIPVEEQDEHGK